MGQDKLLPLLDVHLPKAPLIQIYTPEISSQHPSDQKNAADFSPPGNLLCTLMSGAKHDTQQAHPNRNAHSGRNHYQIPQKLRLCSMGRLLRRSAALTHSGCRFAQNRHRDELQHPGPCQHPIVPAAHFAGLPSAGQQYRQDNPEKHGKQTDGQNNGWFLFHVQFLLSFVIGFIIVAGMSNKTDSFRFLRSPFSAAAAYSIPII